jgi:4-hydroxybutyrate CoA-transferase
MISDGAIDLIESGVIDNSRKAVLPGRSVVSFVLGTRRLYDFIDRNPDVVFQPIDETNNPFVIAQNPKVVAVNAALQVDLTGQGNSESLGTYQLSGVGGQIDFARGAAGAPDGRFIIALPSTAKGGTISRIVPVLEPGAAVTASRSDIDTVVTEFGAARLKGKSLRERAHTLADIAHPDFREDLLRHIRERNW